MILRQVTASRYGGASRYTGYKRSRIFLKLECGHEQSRKASEGCPMRARCRDCERTAPTVERLGESELVRIDGTSCSGTVARKPAKCAWSGLPIEKGDKVYRPLFNTQNRMKRWLASEIDRIAP